MGAWGSGVSLEATAAFCWFADADGAACCWGGCAAVDDAVLCCDAAPACDVEDELCSGAVFWAKLDAASNQINSSTRR